MHDAAESVLAVLQDSTPTVRAKAAWTLGNLSRSLLGSAGGDGDGDDDDGDDDATGNAASHEPLATLDPAVLHRVLGAIKKWPAKY